MVPAGTEYVTRQAYENNLRAIDALFSALRENGSHAHTGVAGQGDQIGTDGMQTNSVTDDILGERTVNSAVQATTDEITLNDFMNGIAYVICSITGETDWKQAAIRSLKSSFVPSGAIWPFAMETPPAGWLKCNGQRYYRADYPTLYQAIGLRWTPDNDGVTFCVPDVRGDYLRFWDDGRGVDVGRLLGSFQPGAVGKHSHAIKGHENHTYQGSGGLTAFSFSWNKDGTYSTEESGATENVVRNTALLACIKC
jgi:microcystin-dependent protein